MACALAGRMCGLYSSRYPSSEAAAEGTAAHEAAANIVEGLPVPEFASNGVAITDEMHAAGHALRERFGEARVHVETRLSMQFGEYTVEGTADYFRHEGERRITDLKFGFRHVPADAEQLKVYACAPEFDGGDVVLEVYQPRDYASGQPWREFTFTQSERKFFKLRVAGQLERIHGAAPGATAGAHCVDCPGAAFCPELRDQSLAAVQRSHPATTEPLPPEALGLELALAKRALELAKARESGLEQEVQHVAATGGAVPGWTVERGSGREFWTNPDAARDLAAAFAVTIDKPALITPNQAIAAGLPAELVRIYTDRKPGEPKVVPSAKSKTLNAFKSA